jgi:hypothetical protein
MTRLAKVEVMLPQASERKVDKLLVFDARCVDAGDRRELLRLFPQLVHLSRAWRVHFLEHGCLACPKPDPTVGIAARLRSRGMAWTAIYEVIGVSAPTPTERKRFYRAVQWKLAHLDAPKLKPSYRYGAGGFCDRCYLRLRRELAKAIRKMHEGRDAMGETAALTQRFDLAQWLLNGDDENLGNGGDLPGRNTCELLSTRG